jgi:hypothetical protein
MKVAKRTYGLPPETVVRFEAAVDPGRRSAKVSELMQAWLDEQERDALRRNVIEGCREMGAAYLEMAREWEPLEEEVARALD